MARAAALRVVLPVVVWPFAAAPLRAVQAFGRGVARLVWRHTRLYERSYKHLRKAYPELPDAEVRAIAERCGAHMAMTLCEGLHMLGRDVETLLGYVDMEGWEHLEAARKQPRPLMLITAHYGNWELLSSTVNGRGVGAWALARKMQDPWLEKTVLAMRARLGTRMIMRGRPGATRLLIETLRGNGVVGVLHDQDISGEGAWVPFFGRPAFTPLGPARLALKYHAIVVPMFIERQDDGRHLARFLAPLDLPDDPAGATAVMTSAVEGQVRRCPEQWVWFHRRWRHRPPAAQAPAPAGEGDRPPLVPGARPVTPYGPAAEDAP